MIDSKYDGPMNVAVGSKSVSIIVLPKPSFDKQNYVAKPGDTVTI